ncbi:MAG: hypothetical protein WCI01_07565 [Chlorobiaceae bacterium]
MTEQEYRDRLRIIANEYADKKLALSRAFAFSRNPVYPGDIISGNAGGRINASSIKHTAKGDYRLPWCACDGNLLTNRRYATAK